MSVQGTSACFLAIELELHLIFYLHCVKLLPVLLPSTVNNQINILPHFWLALLPRQQSIFPSIYEKRVLNVITVIILWLSLSCPILIPPQRGGLDNWSFTKPFSGTASVQFYVSNSNYAHGGLSSFHQMLICWNGVLTGPALDTQNVWREVLNFSLSQSQKSKSRAVRYD